MFAAFRLFKNGDFLPIFKPLALAWFAYFAPHWVRLMLSRFAACHWFNCITFVFGCLRITLQIIDNRGLFRGSKPFKQILAALVLQADKNAVIP